MKNLLLYPIIGLLLLVTTSQKVREQPPQGGKPKDFSLPTPVRNKLPNGLQSTLVQYGAIPKVTISVIIKTGNVHEADNQTWLADLTGEMMKEGTQSLDAASISRKAASMGGEVSVSVSSSQTTLSGSVLSEFAPELIALLADMTMHPSFPPTSLERLKDDLKRQLAVSKTVPQSLAYEQFARNIFKDEPYGRIYPTEQMLSSFTLDDVKEFYRANMGARRTTVYVAGKFNANEVAKAIKESFTPWQAGPEVSYPEISTTNENRIDIIDRKAAPQSTVLLGLASMQPGHKDYVTMMITNSILGGFFGSRITTNIREDKGYTYSPYSTITHYKGASVWYEEADISSEHTGAALQEISNEIARLQNEPPDENELKGVKEYNAGVFVLQNSTPEGIIGQLNFIDLHGLDESYLTDRVRKIYEVTPAMVSEMAKERFRYEDMTLVIVGDKAEIEKQMKKFEALQKL